MNYQEAIDFLETFPNLDQPKRGAVIDQSVMTVEKMRSILEHMKNPQMGRGCVHVTGTKGKGSTSTMTAAMLNRINGPSALFISPHILSYLERITIGSSPISPGVFANGMSELENFLRDEHMSDGWPVSQFQVLIALFFHLVRSWKERINWQVLEVGLGGERDCTNVFPTKDVAIFTPIAVEHKEFLGDTPAEVAICKSGIIRPGCTVVVAPQHYPEATRILKERANELNCRFIDVEQEYSSENLVVENGMQSFVINGPFGRHEITTRLIGKHQVTNAKTAIAAVQSVVNNVDGNTLAGIKAGLRDAWLPGRIDVLSTSPLIIADGAHTKESAEIMWDAVCSLFQFNRVTIVLAINSDKDAPSIIEAIDHHNSDLILTKSRSAKTLLPEQIWSMLSKERQQSTLTSDSVNDAISLAREKTDSGNLILVTGSLYAAGEAREHLCTNS